MYGGRGHQKVLHASCYSLSRGSKLLVSEVLGKEVIGSLGDKLGIVHDVQFDEKGWNVVAISVELEKEVAEEHKMAHRFRKTEVLINVRYVQAVGDKVVLKGSRKELLQLIGSTAS